MFGCGVVDNVRIAVTVGYSETGAIETERLWPGKTRAKGWS